MLICDRFEEDYAIIYDADRKIEVLRSLIDSDVCEGDTVILKDGRYIADKAATKSRHDATRALKEKLGLL